MTLNTMIFSCTEHDLLFYLAYERIKVNERCLEPHLWTYRSRITVDHLRNSVRGEKTVKILDAFLQAVSDILLYSKIH